MSRSKRNRGWLREHRRDPYVKQANRAGFRSRAAYKLLEIDRRDRLLRPGAVVVDLGAAPGGWSQVAAMRVGPQGRVVALDILPMEPIAGVELLRADLRDPGAAEALRAKVPGGNVAVVLCDMAPDLTGVASVDAARATELAERALDLARGLLAPGGSFLVKVFHGEELDEVRRAMRGAFREVHVRKPAASRARSSEVYLLGQGFGV